MARKAKVVIPVQDVRIENHGSIAIVQPLTPAAREWISENVQDDARWWAGGLVVEPRYVENLVEGMMGNGLNVA